ncbi:hypothetical protein KM043_013016 [Ampulex compressa]|nr:hypothetical protein KM043_013016 [Ampulex compressa]
MKAVVLSVFLAAIFLSSQVQGDCFYHGENLTVGEHIRECTRIVCHEDGHISGLGCPEYRCKEAIGYRERDVSKPYPECCGGPICRE